MSIGVGGRTVRVQSRRKGTAGEERAVAWLRSQGWTIRERNFRTRRGEIDVIAEKGSTVAFVEVKAWESLPQSELEYALSARKQWRIAQAARFYLALHPGVTGRQMRFDVIFLGAGNESDPPHRRGVQWRGRLMVRTAKKTDPQKIAELKVKIHDEEYLLQAIQKIAQDLTKNLEHGE